MLFASLSRIFSLNEMDSNKYETFKRQFTRKLVEDDSIDTQDVLALVIPLAAEEITRVQVWDKFANVVLSHEHKLNDDLFQSCSNLAWAFSKVQYQGEHAGQFWKFIERIYKAEINNLREE